MGLLSNQMRAGAAGAAGGGDSGFYTHQIANSCRFTGSNSEAVRTLNTTATNRDKYTFSTWIKRSTISANQYIFGGETDNVNYDTISFASDNTLRHTWQRGGTSGEVWAPNLYRDTSAWMHIVFQFDTTQSTASNRVKIYINGVQSTVSESRYSGMVPQNQDLEFNENGNEVTVGSSYSYNGFTKSYMAQTAGIDGSIVAIGDLGESKNGVWIPKDLSGLTFGNNGFLLDYASSGDMGNDVSGNNNDFTSSGIDTYDQMTDTPSFNSDSNGGNFCTLNPLVPLGVANGKAVLTEGNLLATNNADTYGQAMGNMGVKGGKWYTEWYIKDTGFPSWCVGWTRSDAFETFNGGDDAGVTYLSHMGYFTGSDVWFSPFGSTDINYIRPAYSGWTSAGTAPTTGDIIMCAMDDDAGKMWWGMNGEWGNVGSGTGNPATGANASLTWTASTYADETKFPIQVNYSGAISLNAGQDPTSYGNITAGGYADDTGYGNFKYDVPEGFLSLCQGNLPVADAIDPAQTDDDYPQKLFTSLAYSGDNGGSQTTGFQPDWVWVKRRDGGQSNGLWDSTRGTTKILNSNNTNAEITSSGLTSFNSTGYTMGLYYNQSGNTYASWNWRANGGTTSTNTQGSVDSTVQADPSGAFSIVTWAGSGGSATIGHGLSGSPTFMVAKSRTSSATVMDWVAFHKNMNDGAYPANESRMYWNSTGGYSTGALWQNDNNSSTVFGVTSNISNSSKNYVAYCFTDVEGYCKADYYVGNGSTDNAFVYLGFRPAWIMIKGLTSGAGWNIHDNACSPINVASTALQVNTANAELSNYNIDMLSNGFKIRDADGDLGTNNNKYIYLAMAHNPFKYATAR